MILFLMLKCLTIPSEAFDLEAGSRETRRWMDFLLHERSEQTRQALANAAWYAPQFKRIFAEEKVPADLLWLALIESSFRPAASNPSGARGMFQFKAETARAFGLRVDRKQDERYHPESAARAAARYLRYLRDKFASWELVLAAYNLGEGDLRRTMKARRAHTWIQVRDHVRRETRDYVGKVKAAAVVGNQFLERLDHEPSEPPTEPPKTHRVAKGDTLYSIARRHGIGVSELKRHNGLHNNHIKVGQILRIP